jgi:hypothetical protein
MLPFDGQADPALHLTAVRLTLEAGDRLVSERLAPAGTATVLR